MNPLVQTILKTFERESPTILLALGIGGIPTTTLMGIRATPKYLWMKEEEKEAKERQEGTPLTNLELAKIILECYGPTIIVGTITIACFIGANSIHLRRNAALASLYSISEAALKEYQKKVVEVIGKNKEEKIHDSILQDRLDRDRVSDKDIILTGRGDVLFYDSWSGRYFKSNMEAIRRIQNNLNNSLFNGSETFISLNDLYHEMGLENVKSGKEFGWTPDGNGMLDIRFTSKIAEGQPCIVMEYPIQPKAYNSHFLHGS